MGYTLTIGEAEIEDYGPEDGVVIAASGTTHPDAPDHDSYVGKGSSRSPSYTGWHEFASETGLLTLFYGGGWDRSIPGYTPCPSDYHRKTGLLHKHPGAVILTRGDLEVVREARERRELSNDGRSPGFWDDGGFRPVDNGKDPQLARLLWLEFWIEWALDNCETPTFRNT